VGQFLATVSVAKSLPAKNYPQFLCSPVQDIIMIHPRVIGEFYLAGSRRMGPRGTAVCKTLVAPSSRLKQGDFDFCSSFVVLAYRLSSSTFLCHRSPASCMSFDANRTPNVYGNKVGKVVGLAFRFEIEKVWPPLLGPLCEHLRSSLKCYCIFITLSSCLTKWELLIVVCWSRVQLD